MLTPEVDGQEFHVEMLTPEVDCQEFHVEILTPEAVCQEFHVEFLPRRVARQKTMTVFCADVRAGTQAPPLPFCGGWL